MMHDCLSTVLLVLLTYHVWMHGRLRRRFAAYLRWVRGIWRE